MQRAVADEGLWCEDRVENAGRVACEELWLGRGIDGEGRVEERGDYNAGDEDDTNPVGRAMAGGASRGSV